VNVIVDATLGPLRPKPSLEGLRMTVIDLPKCIPNRFRLDFDVGSVIGFAKTWELNADIRVQKGFPRNFDKNYLFNNPRFMDLVAVCTNEKIDLVFQID
jgi:hypothetical protein